MHAFQDDVYFNENETVPEYLCYDQCMQKYAFQLSIFDFSTTIEEHRMNNGEAIKDWNEFSKKCSNLLRSFYKKLAQVYKYGNSSEFLRNFAAVLASKLPECEKMFHLFKNASAEGKLGKDLSKTSKQINSFAVSCKVFFIYTLSS